MYSVENEWTITKWEHTPYYVLGNSTNVFNIACVGAGQCDHMPFMSRPVWPMLQIGFTYLKDAEPQGCYKLHLINNFWRVTDTHFLDLRRTKGWVDPTVTWFWLVFDCDSTRLQIIYFEVAIWGIKIDQMRWWKCTESSSFLPQKYI